MKASPQHVYVQPWANIEWQTPVTPGSREYGDIYWSRDQALAEKRHVFIEGNRLAERWADCRGAGFTLCETGFGFGINCLLTANLWRRINPGNAILNYIAFEKSPVSPADLARLHDQLKPGGDVDAGYWRCCVDRLIARYPLPSSGPHLIWLDDDICLCLMIGDVRDTLADLAANVDAWYLDGFSPRVNPDIWQTALFAHMATLSRPGASFATYSVAGDVRRGLAAAGFTTERAAGYGRKAEMLEGRMPGQWRPRPLNTGTTAIIGAGLAGLHCAAALARRGVTTHVFDKAERPLLSASQVPRLAVSPRLATRPDRGNLFSPAAFQYAMGLPEAHACGYLRLATRTRDLDRQARIAELFPPDFCERLTPADIAARTGMQVNSPGLWFAGAGWCSPASQFAVLPARIQLHTATEVTGLESDEHSVRLTTAAGVSHEFEQVVIATGALPFGPARQLPLVPVRGQSIAARVSDLQPRHVISGSVSILPGEQDDIIAGSTFDHGDSDPAVRQADTRLLATRLKQLTGGDITVTAAWAGVRCTTRDRLPVAGRLPDWGALADWCRTTRRTPFTAYQPRLYVCTGFGSHGATNSPLCAEHIARLITGGPNALTGAWQAMLDAARFAKKGDGGI